MTDKEFKKLSKAQLLDIIYELQLKLDETKAQKEALQQQLDDKRLRLSNVGSIAEAALEINNCFLSAQAAAEQYLFEIQALREDANNEGQRIIASARTRAQAILANAQNKADLLLAQAAEQAEAPVEQEDAASALDSACKFRVKSDLSSAEEEQTVTDEAKSIRDSEIEQILREFAQELTEDSL